MHCNICLSVSQLLVKAQTWCLCCRELTEYAFGNDQSEGVSSRSFSIVEEQIQHGPYNWLAPEILGGAGPTEKSDLYSLCAIMWEIIHGQCILIYKCAHVGVIAHVCMLAYVWLCACDCVVGAYVSLRACVVARVCVCVCVYMYVCTCSGASVHLAFVLTIVKYAC